MKRRYNHETKQWDVVLTESDYIDLWYKAYSHFRPYKLDVTYKVPWYMPPTNLSTFLSTEGN